MIEALAGLPVLSLLLTSRKKVHSGEGVGRRGLLESGLGTWQQKLSEGKRSLTS